MAYVCLKCNKTYSTSSHLRRHEASHQSTRPFFCNSCHRSFARSDVFRRHAQNCPENGTSSPPPAAKPGRKKASCDHCARVKASCDRDLPCERCLASGVICTYSRLTTSITPDEAPSVIPREEKMSIAFLLSYTKSTTFFSDLIQLSPDHGGGSSALECPPECPLDILNNTPSLWSPCLPPLDISFSDMMCDMLGTPTGYFEGMYGQEDTTSLLQATIDPLQEQVDNILRELKHFITVTDHLHAEPDQPAPAVLSKAAQAITGPNIRLGISAYFSYVYPNCPFVHEPSFEPGSASSQLLLSMFAAGHSVLQTQICTLPTELLDLIEDYVFHDSRLDIPYNGHAPVIIEALQAATIAIQTRAATGDPRIQQRIRDCRFPRLINALRSYPAFNSENSVIRDFGTVPFDWQLFIQEECLIRITFAVFMLDTHFTIFFRAPSRATIQEITGDLPCPDSLFMAETSQCCQMLLQTTAVLRPPSLASLITVLMHDMTFDPQDRGLQGLTVRHLFLLIIGFHAVIFSAQKSCIMAHVYHAAERALDRWKMLWDTTVNSSPTSDQLARIGLMRFAPQFWSLAKMVISPGVENVSLDKVNVWTKDYIHEFMQKAR
ncbi:hypothetical protein BDV12DRAFT_168143 [Aspergillus spectabilis]